MTDDDFDPDRPLTREELIALLRAPLPTIRAIPGRSWSGNCTNGDTPESRERFITYSRWKARYYGGAE